MAVPRGALMSCTTNQGDELRGDVIAMDESTKMVIIKDSRDSSTNTIHIINLHHVSNMEVESHTPSDPPSGLPNINLHKVQLRLEQNVKAKLKKVSTRGVNVSAEAQQLFDSLLKVYDETRWDGDVIVILGDVRISPPYTADSCTGSNSLLSRIQKQVKKFQEDKRT